MGASLVIFCFLAQLSGFEIFFTLLDPLFKMYVKTKRHDNCNTRGRTHEGGEKKTPEVRELLQKSKLVAETILIVCYNYSNSVLQRSGKIEERLKKRLEKRGNT